MPNKNTPWNVESNSGNPTRSIVVNKLIKAIKKKEVRKEGVPSQARRALQIAEYLQLVRLLHEEDDHTRSKVISCMIKVQFHMIGRLDDVCQFKTSELKSHSNFPFLLTGRLCWSKNVQDERDAPDQILFPSKEWEYCVYIGLAVHLETFLATGDGENNDLLFGICGPGQRGVSRLKDRASNILKNIFESEQFDRVLDGNLGSHSLWKLPATYARRNGASRDDIDTRGRWKKNTRQVDTYIDTLLPYPDARVASILSIGGCVK